MSQQMYPPRPAPVTAVEAYARASAIDLTGSDEDDLDETLDEILPVSQAKRKPFPRDDSMTYLPSNSKLSTVDYKRFCAAPETMGSLVSKRVADIETAHPPPQTKVQVKKEPAARMPPPSRLPARITRAKTATATSHPQPTSTMPKTTKPRARAVAKQTKAQQLLLAKATKRWECHRCKAQDQGYNLLLHVDDMLLCLGCGHPCCNRCPVESIDKGECDAKPWHGHPQGYFGWLMDVKGVKVFLHETDGMGSAVWKPFETQAEEAEEEEGGDELLEPSVQATSKKRRPVESKDTQVPAKKTRSV